MKKKTWNQKVLLRLLYATVLFCFQVDLLAQEVRIAHASSMIPVIEKLKAQVEESSDIRIVSIPAASGTLTHQIINGAPFDIFVSADPAYCMQLEKKNLTVKSDLRFISGKLALWSSKKLDIQSQTLEEAFSNMVKGEKFRTLAIADPDIAPYGAKAKEWLIKKDIISSGQSLILGQNISIVNQYISTQSVSAAITSESSRIQLQNQSHGSWHTLEVSEETVVDHCICLLVDRAKNASVYSILSSDSFLESIELLGYSRHFDR